MGNPNNNGNLIGRVSQDIKVLPNRDGSTTLLITIAADDNYRSGAKKEIGTQFVPVRVYVPKSANGIGSWERVHKGDLIAIQYRIGCTPYQKDGKTVYPEPSIEVEGYASFLEPKSVTDARAARKALEAPAAADAPVEETTEQQLARLQAEMAALQGTAPVGDPATTTPYSS